MIEPAEHHESTAVAPADTTVFIFAAGHGSRMLPLTQRTPKPLLRVGKYALIEHHLRRLADMGFRHVVINVAYLAEQIMQRLDTGQQFGLDIQFSDESTIGALETAGGIRHALPLIKSDHFITINADIWTDFPFAQLLNAEHLKALYDATLVLVDNPEHNPTGDFGISAHGELTCTPPLFTFSGIARYQKSVFMQLEPGKRALAPMLRDLIKEKSINGWRYTGEWQDIGTPERLQALRQRLDDI